MPHRDWRLRLTDIVESAEKIREYVAGMDLEGFSRDSKTVDAVVRNLEVIGEAASSVPEWLQSKYPEVPWVEMRGMRNVLAHECFGLSLGIAWQTAQVDLPALVSRVKTILEQER
jgi:uncharacterized protein with HEPN domain